MQVTNVRGHRIRWRLVFAQGALVGVVSALAMLAVAAMTYPLGGVGGDAWSFLKVVSTVLLGDDAATPLAGFAFVPVAVGLVVHLCIGAAVGASYAVFVAFFDLEGWTPVALFGLLYGAMTFVWAAAFIGAGLGGAAIEDVPIASMLWGNVVFGLTAGLLLASWADRADLDQPAEERVAVFEDDRRRPAAR